MKDNQYKSSLIEKWSAGNSHLYLYTEVKAISDMLKRDFNRFAIYYMRGRIVAWQFLIPARLEKIIIRRLSDLKVLKIQ